MILPPTHSQADTSSMKKFFARSGVLVFVMTFAGWAEAEDRWRIESGGPAWTVVGQIEKPKAVSGAAVLTPGHGVLVSDETRVVQPFLLDLSQRTLVVAEPLTVLAGSGKELDLEAVTAWPGGHCYVAAGSHAVARTTGEVQPDRLHVFRLPVHSASSAIQSDSIQVATLMPVIRSDAVLREAVGKTADNGGLDIEGLAEKKGQLFFGLRSPSIDGRALIIEVDADKLFSDDHFTTHRTHRIMLGTGLGIRDIAAVRDGFLFIAGPSSSTEAAHGFTLHYWPDPDGKAASIGDIPSAKGKKAEGLVVLGETDDSVDVLVLYDGAENGAPTPIRITKPGKR